jgi:spore maturation protein CgeB
MLIPQSDNNPRILVIGKRGGILQWPEHVYRACQSLELNCRFLALNHQDATDRLIKKSKQLISKSLADQHLATQLRNCLREFQPTLLIFTDLIALSDAFKSALVRHKGDTKIIYWIGDFFPDSLKQYNTFVDRFYFTDSHLECRAQKLGLNAPGYLPLAVDSAAFGSCAKPWENREDIVLFIGAYSDNRYEILKAIQQPARIYGKGWNKALPAAHQIMPHNIPLQEVARLYGQHKFVLNIINSNNIKCGLNMRCFEATAAGAILVTDWVEDLPRCFASEKDVLYYRSVDQLEGLTSTPEHILKQIALSGQQKTLTTHDYTHRIQQIIDEPRGET